MWGGAIYPLHTQAIRYRSNTSKEGTHTCGNEDNLIPDNLQLSVRWFKWYGNYGLCSKGNRWKQSNWSFYFLQTPLKYRCSSHCKNIISKTWSLVNCYRKNHCSAPVPCTKEVFQYRNYVPSFFTYLWRIGANLHSLFLQECFSSCYWHSKVNSSWHSPQLLKISVPM